MCLGVTVLLEQPTLSKFQPSSCRSEKVVLLLLAVQHYQSWHNDLRSGCLTSTPAIILLVSGATYFNCCLVLITIFFSRRHLGCGQQSVASFLVGTPSVCGGHWSFSSFHFKADLSRCFFDYPGRS